MPAVDALLRFPTAVRQDAAIEVWLAAQRPELRILAEQWFGAMRRCGSDVRELMHDHMPTACVGDVAFGYVNAFTAHVNVGFFRGAFLSDPAGLLHGTGKRMRHIKLRPDLPVNEDALRELIAVAYADMREQLHR